MSGSAEARTAPGRSRAGALLARVFGIVGNVVLVAMTLHIVANALMRWLLNDPLPSTNELVTYWYMPALALVGAVACQIDRAHTEARVLWDKFPAPVQREVHALGQCLAAVMCALLAWFGMQEALHGKELGLTGGVTGLVIWPALFLVPICFTLLTGMFLRAAWDALRGRHAEPVDEQMRDLKSEDAR